MGKVEVEGENCERRLGGRLVCSGCEGGGGCVEYWRRRRTWNREDGEGLETCFCRHCFEYREKEEGIVEDSADVCIGILVIILKYARVS